MAGYMSIQEALKAAELSMRVDRDGKGKHLTNRDWSLNRIVRAGIFKTGQKPL